MNEIWGSYEPTLVWGWAIGLYLFLAGLSSGAMMCALSVEWLNPARKKPWDAFVKAGVLIAPLAIIAGLLILVCDLTKPASFYLLLTHYNFNSVMSLGVILLLFYTPLCVIYAILRFRSSLENGFLGTLVKKCSGILDFLENKSLWLGRLIFVLAAGVGVYTGFLLSAVQTYPLFNSPILPILFLASGISSGIAACIFFGILCFSKDISQSNTKTLLMADLRVIPIELLLIFALFAGLFFQGGQGAIAAVASLSSGAWAFVFWLGVIGLGIATPTLIALTALKNHAYKVNFILLNSFAVLVGVLALRLFILYAGQLNALS